MFVTIGEQDYFGVPFPLVLADRYFHAYRSPHGYKLDVFRWDEYRKRAVYDMKGSVYQVEVAGRKPDAIIKFEESEPGTIVCKYRPRPGAAQIAGKVPINDEFEVKVQPNSIVVSVGSQPIAEIDKNTLTGCMIGARIGADGSFDKGSDTLPNGMDLMRAKTIRVHQTSVRTGR